MFLAIHLTKLRIIFLEIEIRTPLQAKTFFLFLNQNKESYFIKFLLELWLRVAQYDKWFSVGTKSKTSV